MFRLPTTTTKEQPRTLTLDVIAGTAFLTIKQWKSGKREETDRYTVAPLESEIGGKGFEVTRITPGEDAETYHVLVGGQHSTCTCRGFTYHGFHKSQHGLRSCKHLDALIALLQRGELPSNPPPHAPALSRAA